MNLIQADTTNFAYTGLGHEFDSLVTLNQLANYRLKPPYNEKFMDRPLFTIYGIVTKVGLPIGKLFLEMVSYSSKDKEERGKVSSFLIAMNKIESETEVIQKRHKKIKSREVQLCFL